MARRPLWNSLYGGLTSSAATLARRTATVARRTPADHDGGAARTAPTGPQLGDRSSRDGLNPFLVLGGALATGIVLAKIVDWRSHAHRRD